MSRKMLSIAAKVHLIAAMFLAPTLFSVPLATVAPWLGVPSALADDGFVDDFEDGIIDPSHWTYGGTITESDGVLHLDREDPDDFIQTNATFSGDWTLEMDIRLDEIVWNDMFHGISLTDETGLGISFGYSMYGKLFLAVHDGQGGSGYYYAANGTNQPGQWLNWKFVRSGGTVTVLVNDSEPIPGAWIVPEDARIRMPGIYEDGDGGPHSGVTSSSVDFFSIVAVPSSVPDLTPRVELGSWGEVKAAYR